MDDIIKLVTITYATDVNGNQIETRTERQVFCKVNSVGRTEYYEAAQNDLHPSYVFTLANYKDYNGEREIKYKDWTNTEKIFTVTRTYRTGDRLDITAEELVRNL